MNSNYYYKYKKYKHKYQYLEGIIKGIDIGGDKRVNKENFYFIHSALDFDTLISILKDGVIYAGKYISPERRKLSKTEPSDYVYTNIYFDDIKNIKHPWGFDLILGPQLLYKNGLIFNKGWLVYPGVSDVDSFYINKNYSEKKINEQLKKIREYIKSSLKTRTKKKSHSPDILNHEVLFKDRIILDGNLLAIICTGCDDNQLNIIKGLMKNKPYKIFKTNKMPTLEEIN